MLIQPQSSGYIIPLYICTDAKYLYKKKYCIYNNHTFDEYLHIFPTQFEIQTKHPFNSIYGYYFV